MTTDMLNHALSLASVGYSVIPLTPPDTTRFDPDKAGKKPLPCAVDWPTRKPATEDQILKWWTKFPDANIGVVCGRVSQIVCVDIDPRNGGLAWWSAHEKEIVATHPVIEASGRCDGGKHIYYQIAPDTTLVSRDFAPGVNFLSDGRQVVTAPSVHAATGKPYQIISPLSLLDRDFIPFVPDFLKQYLTEIPLGEGTLYKGSHSLAVQLQTTVCDPETRDKLVFQLATLDGSHGRHHTAGMWIINAVAAGMPDEEIESLCTDWFRDNGREPQQNEISNWIRDAYRGLSEGRYQPSLGIAKAFGFEVVSDGAGGIDPVLEEASIKAQSTMDWTRTLARSDKGKIFCNRRNAEIILANDEAVKHLFAYNEMAQSAVLVRRPPWDTLHPIRPDGTPVTDIDYICLSSWIAEHYGFEPGKDRITDVVAVDANLRKFHPVREYLSSLVWDGVPRLDGMLEKMFRASDDPRYLSAVGSKWMISCVARAFNPGCKVDYVMVLEGKQGIYKSSALRVLGGRWFTDDMGGELGSKDSIDALRFAWIVEMPELHGLSRATITQYTSFISRQIDRVRLSYGRCTSDIPRGYVFSGSTNQEAYLRDETGNRRFWPVSLWSLENKDGCRVYIDEVSKNRDQLWAEAVVRFRAGESWHIEDAMGISDLVKAQQDARFQNDAWIDPIRVWLDGGDAMGNGVPKDKVTAMQIWVEALGGGQAAYDRTCQLRVASVMTRLGWVRARFSRGGVSCVGWMRG